MNKIKFTILALFITLVATAQSNPTAFKKGEWLKYRLSYSNFFSAGIATLHIKEAKNKGKEAFHVVGRGKTTGMISWFFKVKDNYETYFEKKTMLPYRFVRNINEGGYKKNKELFFDQRAKKVLIKDKKHNKQQTLTLNTDVQDMISTLYFLRNKNLKNIKVNDEIGLTMFFDEEHYKFKLRFLGKETIKTKFGKVKTLKFRPIVQAGRVFKEQESLTVWVSADENKIPLRIKASLAVGSLRADLDAYKGLANPFPIIF